MRHNKENTDKKNLNKDKKYETYYEEEETKRRFPPFILLILFTTFGVMLALGLSLAAVKYIGSNETINTLISKITGKDNKDQFIITYVENIKDGSINNPKEGELHIIDAKFYKATNGGSGVVTFFGGLMFTTKTTFPSKSSTVTYEVTIKNESSVTKIFEELLYNKSGELKYTLTGINKGDKLKPGESRVVYVTIESTGSDDYPKTIESSAEVSFSAEDKSLHIIDAKVKETKGDATGEVVNYSGLMITTKTTFPNQTSSVTYEITIKNDTSGYETFYQLVYNKDGDVKYTLTGIDEGYTFAPGESKVVYLTVENNGNSGNNDFPKTIESSVSFQFTPPTGYVVSENGIYLINQFPTRDEVGKLFQGENYVFNFALILGQKAAGAYYEITAVPNKDNTLNPNYAKVYLEKNNKGVDMSYRNTGRVKVFTEYPDSQYEEAVGKVIYKGTVTEEEVKNGKINFVLRMWVSEDVKIDESNMMEYAYKKFGVRINTYATFLQG